MYESLIEHSSDFHLYIFAFDFDYSAYKILRDLKLESVTVISLTELEIDELLDIKKIL